MDTFMEILLVILHMRSRCVPGPFPRGRGLGTRLVRSMSVSEGRERIPFASLFIFFQLFMPFHENFISQILSAKKRTK